MISALVVLLFKMVQLIVSALRLTFIRSLAGSKVSPRGGRVRESAGEREKGRVREKGRCQDRPRDLAIGKQEGEWRRHKSRQLKTKTWPPTSERMG